MLVRHLQLCNQREGEIFCIIRGVFFSQPCESKEGRALGAAAEPIHGNGLAAPREIHVGGAEAIGGPTAGGDCPGRLPPKNGGGGPRGVGGKPAASLEVRGRLVWGVFLGVTPFFLDLIKQ